jgi:glycosyltransferase involved in cell wall biosynthesis
MKILIVTQYFAPENFRINALAESLKANGHDITILTGQPNYPEGKIYPGYRAWRITKEIHPSGIAVFRMPLVPRGNGSALRLTLNYLSFVATSIPFGFWCLKGQEIDVIFVYGASPILQCLTGISLRATRKVPLILWVQDLWPESLFATGYVKSKWLLDLVGVLVRWIYRRCDLLLSQSLSFVEKIKAMAPDVPIAYYPNPGDATLDVAISSSEKIQLPEGFNVLFAGNLGSVQAVETIIEAGVRLKHIGGLNIVILGSGSRLGWMGQEVKRQLLKNVFLFGRVELAVALDAMKRSDALLVSLKNTEALNRTVPSKLSTYLGVGRPIIASMNGEGASLVTESGAGIACEAENAEALANGILVLMGLSKELRDEMGRAGRRWYDAHLELNALTQTLVEHFEASRRGKLRDEEETIHVQGKLL